MDPERSTLLLNSCGPNPTRSEARTGTLRGPARGSGHYFAMPLGGDGLVGLVLVGAAPVVSDGLCFGRLGALAVGGMLTPLPDGLLFEANTNSSTAATNTAAATHPHTALTSPVARSNSGRR